MEEKPRDGRRKGVRAPAVLIGLGVCLWLGGEFVIRGGTFQNTLINVGVLFIVLGFCLLVVAFSKKKSP